MFAAAAEVVVVVFYANQVLLNTESAVAHGSISLHNIALLLVLLILILLTS